MSPSFLEERLGKLLSPNPLSAAARALLQELIAVSKEGEIALTVDPLLPELKELQECTVFEEGKLYLPRHYAYEKAIFSDLKRLMSQPARPLPSPDLSHLESEQQQAVLKALQFPITWITGGPGTGKSHTAKTILQAFLDAGKENLIITAPTGKAAAHLAKKIAHPKIRSGTLHSFLKGEDPLLIADLILVDESSMIGAKLFSQFLAALPLGVRVVFLGDQNQLPPVEAGKIFADCIQKIDRECLTTLTFCHRTDNQEILQLATRILEEKELPFQPLTFDRIEKVLSLFPQAMTSPPGFQELKGYQDQVCILSCIRKGPFGADRINQDIFHRLSHRGRWLAMPIIITKNDYSLELYNGDTGFLVSHPEYPEEGYALFLGKERKLPEAALPPFDLAYALSVHKSQGSEYDQVIVLIPEGSERFGKEILYTAVTRAKKEVVLLK